MDHAQFKGGRMTVTFKLAVFAVLSTLLVLFHKLPGQNQRVRFVRGLLILLVVTCPMLLDPRPRTVVQGSLFLFFIGLERLFQRNAYDFTSHEHFLHATYATMLRGIYLAVGYYWLDWLNGAAVPWGFEAHHSPIWLEAIAIFLVVDVFRYWVHRFQHKFDFWWRFHKIHHSAEQITALAADRLHLIEAAPIAVIFPTLIAYLLGVRADVFLFASQIPGVILANAYAHANIDFPKTKAWWAYILNSPNAHSHHHTKQHDRTNYGSTLLVWDWLFGTLDIPKEPPSDFGINEPEIAKMGIMAHTLHPVGLK
jgi:sterol desaturase/sphingolipid hydroxylase (fatty acid hydroxylase superfamily)